MGTWSLQISNTSKLQDENINYLKEEILYSEKSFKVLN